MCYFILERIYASLFRDNLCRKSKRATLSCTFTQNEQYEFVFSEILGCVTDHYEDFHSTQVILSEDIRFKLKFEGETVRKFLQID